jgi:hypothetical protein
MRIQFETREKQISDPESNTPPPQLRCPSNRPYISDPESNTPPPLLRCHSEERSDEESAVAFRARATLADNPTGINFRQWNSTYFADSLSR